MKQIKNYPGYYIDESGIYSNKRYIMKKLKPYIANTGYIHYCLYDDSKTGKPFYTTFHQILYETYIGKYDTSIYTIDHINNNKLDNRLENLQILTRGDNVRKSENGKIQKSSKKCVYNGTEYESIRQCCKANHIDGRKKTIILL